MITREQADRIKTILGPRYTSLVQEQLQAVGAKGKNGEDHTKNYIRVVFSGYRSDEVIETAIYDAVKDKIRENEKREALLKEKSTAATADS